MRPLGELLNLRHALAKARGWKEKLPTLAEAAKLVAREVNLLRRPILIVGKDVIVGFHEDTYRRVAKPRR